MNGAHDLGGKHGFGPIDRSQTEDFAHTWEERVFGLTLTCGMLGHWNLDQSRYARESTDPAHYLSSTYYEHWLHGLETLLLENKLVSKEELAGISQGAAGENNHAVPPDAAIRIVETGAPTQLKARADGKFLINDRVVVINENPKGHTRVPSYMRGVVGTVVRLHGAHIYADEHARSGDKVAEHLYSVRFEAEAIWGKTAETKSAVYIDLFEPYLISLDEYQQSLQHTI